MRSEWDKCNFCKYYDDFDGCQIISWECDFKLSQDRVIEKAKQKDISCSDVLALMEK